jgi:diacylglycerol kinase
MIKISKFALSIRNALLGLKYIITSQNNARIHLLITIIVISLGFLLQIDGAGWIFLTLTIAIVWICEAFNTSLEKLFDLVEPHTNPLVKIGKDASAAAVLISAYLSVVIGFIVFLPPIIELVKRLFSFD